MSPALSFRVLSVTSLPTWRQSTAQVSGMGHGELPLSAFVRARGRATGSQPPHRSLGSQLTHSLSLVLREFLTPLFRGFSAPSAFSCT